VDCLLQGSLSIEDVLLVMARDRVHQNQEGRCVDHLIMYKHRKE